MAFVGSPSDRGIASLSGNEDPPASASVSIGAAAGSKPAALSPVSPFWTDPLIRAPALFFGELFFITIVLSIPTISQVNCSTAEPQISIFKLVTFTHGTNAPPQMFRFPYKEERRWITPIMSA
ncbi:hypothetical protein [Brucella sp. NBRC 113783]|uniref:hypothetical protein n=1 Tax=Brucella sp. NBRC 113783 TaxID=3075478 RepID=UPI003341BA0C